MNKQEIINRQNSFNFDNMVTVAPAPVTIDYLHVGYAEMFIMDTGRISVNNFEAAARKASQGIGDGSYYKVDVSIWLTDGTGYAFHERILETDVCYSFAESALDHFSRQLFMAHDEKQMIRLTGITSEECLNLIKALRASR